MSGADYVRNYIQIQNLLKHTQIWQIGFTTNLMEIGIAHMELNAHIIPQCFHNIMNVGRLNIITLQNKMHMNLG